MNRISQDVALILDRVRREGDRALSFYSLKFDRVRLRPGRFELSRTAMKESYFRLPGETRKALSLIRSRVEKFHREELMNIRRSWSFDSNGIGTGQQSSPLQSAGIYVPGGRFCYPSTVFMTAIPAKVAGVETVVMVTPFKNLKDEILAAAYLCGVDRLFCVGGPAAIAALAFGTRTIPRVDKIVGPGNAYVTEAKRQVYGIVGIDGLAGPSEVAVWADASADPERIALNLMAQAEHDPDSRSQLFSLDARVIDSVRARVGKEFLKQVRCVKAKSEAEVVSAINEAAPEHLLLAIKHPRRVLAKMRTAGAIFLGDSTPVPLGDYAAGPSHVLPTGGSGRFASGLSVRDFLRWSSVIETKSRTSSKVYRAAKLLAEIEGLRHHARSLE